MKYKIGKIYKIQNYVKKYQQDDSVVYYKPGEIILIVDYTNKKLGFPPRYKFLINNTIKYAYESEMHRLWLEEIN